jgi:hypothetical protein
VKDGISIVSLLAAGLGMIVDCRRRSMDTAASPATCTDEIP